MKRQGNLIEQIADIGNLQLAWYKAQKGKAAKRSVFEYGQQLRANLAELQQQIVSGKVVTGNYHFFTIYELDFQKYFDSLDQAILKNQLNHLFKDRRLLTIFESIIDSYSVEANKGVPIGNLTSQYFANHYLAAADHFIKEVLGIKAYARYMDDLVLWHHHKASLLEAGLRLKQYSEEQLQIKLKPFCLNRNPQGLPFLGYLVYPDKIRLARRSRNRFIKKLFTYENNLQAEIWTQEEYQKHVLPLIAFTEHAQAREFRKKVLAGYDRLVYFSNEVNLGSGAKRIVWEE